MPWDAANARARGLATHLLDREALLRAADSGSRAAALRTLTECGYPLPEACDALAPADLDRTTGRILARRLHRLGRWLGAHRDVLAVIYEDEERRTLRALLRGAAQGASPAARLTSLTPTPTLPERALEQLASAESPVALARLLVKMGHPAGRVLAVASRSDGSRAAPPGLWRQELALSRLFARRATRAARHAGAAVRRFAALLIDLENAWSLLSADQWGPDVPAEDVFLEGGAVLSPPDFRRIAGLADPARVRSAIAKAFGGTPLRRLFEGTDGEAELEGRAIGSLLAWQRAEARQDPLGPGVVLGVIQGFRAEAHDVRLVLGAAALGAPRSAVEAAMVTPR